MNSQAGTKNMLKSSRRQRGREPLSLEEQQQRQQYQQQQPHSSQSIRQGEEDEEFNSMVMVDDHGGGDQYEKLMEKYVECRTENSALKQDVHLMIDTTSQLTRQHQSEKKSAQEQSMQSKIRSQKQQQNYEKLVHVLQTKTHRMQKDFDQVRDKYSRTKYAYHDLKDQAALMEDQFRQDFSAVQQENQQLKQQVIALQQQLQQQAQQIQSQQATINSSRRSMESSGSKNGKKKGSGRDWKQEYYYEKKYRLLKQDHLVLIQQTGVAVGVADTSTCGTAMEHGYGSSSRVSQQTDQSWCSASIGAAHSTRHAHQMSDYNNSTQLMSPLPPSATFMPAELQEQTLQKDSSAGSRKLSKSSKWAILTAAATIAASTRKGSGGVAASTARSPTSAGPRRQNSQTKAMPSVLLEPTNTVMAKNKQQQYQRSKAQGLQPDSNNNISTATEDTFLSSMASGSLSLEDVIYT